jgi:4a-hydroxytetrahydrobiopterin dehydratase
MAKKLDDSAVDAWVSTHQGWARVHQNALAKDFRFPDFGAALGFVVRLGCAAEKKDHHPDVELGWGRAKITWSTHDAGGITELDLAMAEATDGFAR